jgi:hypothetical protein
MRIVTPDQVQEIFMPRNGLGHWEPGTSGNPGGRPRPPDGLRTRLAKLSPRAVERLAELLDSSDESVARCCSCRGGDSYSQSARSLLRRRYRISSPHER